RRWIAAEDAGRYREAMGASLPIGLPEVFLDAGVDPLASLLRRFARTHVPFVTADPAKRWALSTQSVEAALTRMATRGDVLAGEFRKVAEGREYCHPEVLRILRRRSLAALRREVESVPPDALARFLRGDAPRLVPPSVEPPRSELHEGIRGHLGARGASFFRDIYNSCGGGDEEVMLEALWDLVWSGEVTNDTFAPLRLLGPMA